MLRRCLPQLPTQFPAGHYALLAGARRNTNGPATRLQPLGGGNMANVAGIAEHLRSAQFNLDEKTGQVVEMFDFPAPVLTDATPLEDRLGGLQERMTLIDLMAYLPGKWSLSPAMSSGKHYTIKRSSFSGEAETLHAAIEVARVLRSLPIRIRTVTISLENSHVWNIEGDYYAKNN